MSEIKKEVIHTKIWNEIPEDDNPFAAKQCFCAGYNVYEDLIGKASWIEYLFLLFKLEKPTEQQAKLLEAIAIAIANPGIRDHSVRAAMNAGVAGSTSASALMAAIAVGAGQYGGAREVYSFIKIWENCGKDISKWENEIKNLPQDERADVWEKAEHAPGFDPNAMRFAEPTRLTLDYLADLAGPNSYLDWIKNNRNSLEEFSSFPLALTGVIATAFFELKFSADQGEMLFLLLRLPGASAHALEQKELGIRKFPFFKDSLHIKNDPHA